MTAEKISPAVIPQRLASIDAYRGLVMFLMMAEVLRFSAVAHAIPDSALWGFLAYHQSHVAWIGCSLHDLIQPSFSFLVGVALPFSIASRLAKGHTYHKLALHAFWRAFLLILLGIFLRSIGKTQTYFTFEDTLTQIGLGYGFLFLLGFRPKRDQWIALGLILTGYWLAFALYPLPGPEFDYAQVGVATHSEQVLTGFAAHWSKNSNLAWAFDTWFLNLFPREKPFLFNGGGYATLSFLPTLGTMILGLLAGGILRETRTIDYKIRWLTIAGILGLVSGLLLGWLGINPVVKRIWTPSWTLFSGGWCFLFLAGFCWLMDKKEKKSWAFPLMVIGANSITAYCMDHLFNGFITSSWKTHLGQNSFQILGKAYEPFLLGCFVLATLWGILYWMYQRKIFLKI